MSVVFVIIAFLQTFSLEVVSFYNNSETIQNLAVKCLYSYTIAYGLDAVQVMLQGVIKGLGIQQRAQNSALVSFFFVGLPSAYLLAFHYGYGIEGLWYGYSIGLLILVLLYSFLIFTADWNEIVKNIR